MCKLKVASHQQVHQSARLTTCCVHPRAAAAQNLTTTTSHQHSRSQPNTWKHLLLRPSQ